MDHQDILSGFIRLHVLHHAAEGDLYGQWMIDELAHHGYKVSAGTLYPMLHQLHEAGLLVGSTEIVGGKRRKYYRATPEGAAALEEAKARLRELVAEVLHDRVPEGWSGRPDDGDGST